MPCHNNFSNAEIKDIVSVYGKSNYIGRTAAQRYLKLYSVSSEPHYRTFNNIYDQIAETGYIRSKRDAKIYKYSESGEECVNKNC